MSLEAGGRADKRGNEYENQQLAWRLLELVKGEASCVTVEPLGPSHDSVEYVVERPDGVRDYYQCKASNAGRNSWSVANLKFHQVFTRILEIMNGDSCAHYHFLSPLPFNELDELCNRARTNNSAREWLAYQVNNEKLRRALRDCAAEFGLDDKREQDKERLRFLLSRCHFELMPYTETATRQLENYIGAVFTGDARAIRMLLENYVNGNGKYGVKIAAKEIIDACAKANFSLCDDFDFQSALSRIETLNRDYWPECPKLCGKLAHRRASEEALEAIQAGRSVILHGKAGSGKSGCLQEILNSLKATGILYLAVKLDKVIPRKSAHHFGEELKLPRSPIYALSRLAGGKPCVLILDQLDALRWTSPHSVDALDVCKEMISQAESVNARRGKLSLAFACRTSDLELDSGLQRLFANESSLLWDKVRVEPFTEEEVIGLIGEGYRDLPPRLKALLRVPSSLYVWTNIRKENRADITSAVKLMDAWWKQILKAAGSLRQSVCDCKDEIVRYMEANALFKISQGLFSEKEQEIDFLVSSGILDARAGAVSFVHQSFLDYFISQKLLKSVYEGKNIAELIGPLDRQTPNIRYRLLTVLRELSDTGQGMFVQQARNLLTSASVRYYLQCCVFEVAGQCEEPSEAMLSLTDEYVKLPQWREYVLNAAYLGHPAFVRRFWRVAPSLSDEALSLLRSVAVRDSAFVADILRRSLAGNPQESRKLFAALPYNCVEEGEELFRFRMELLENNPDLLDAHTACYFCIQKQSVRAVDYMELVLRNWEKGLFSNAYFGEASQLSQYAEARYMLIIERLFPLICDLTRAYQPRFPLSFSCDRRFSDWTASGYPETAYRQIVTLTGDALKKFAQTDGPGFCAFLSAVQYPLSGIGHELLMEGLSALSTERGDVALSWLLSDFREKAFVFSSGAEDFLRHTGILIRRFSPYCAQDLFERLEKAVCGWRDDAQWAKRRLEYRLETLRQGKMACYPYWGGFQKTLLPCFDSKRLSPYGKELLQVLDRNPCICIPFYVKPFSAYVETRSAFSRDFHAGRLTDKTWLQIICAPDNKIGRVFRWRGDGTTAATHATFAESLGQRAKLEPIRFAKLALSFPEDCFPGYIFGVLAAIAEPAQGTEPVPLELAAQVMRRFAARKESDIAQEIAWILLKRPKEDWPEDILSILDRYVLYDSDCAAQNYSSIESIQDATLNSMRGFALSAIAELLRHCRERGERFRHTVETACHDSDASVKFAAMSCALAYYRMDADFASRLYETLLSGDLRILAARGSWTVLSGTYERKREWYRAKIERALASDFTGLPERSAEILCALAVYLRDDDMLESVLTRQFTEKQREKICQQAVRAFAGADFRERSERVLRRFMDESASRPLGLERLFRREWLSVERDSDFLTNLMRSAQGARLLYPFLRFLKESGEKIRAYAEIFKAIGDDMASDTDKWRQTDLSNFIQCVILLLDESVNDSAAQTVCLDILDTLFRRGLYTMTPISILLDDFDPLSH